MSQLQFRYMVGVCVELKYYFKLTPSGGGGGDPSEIMKQSANLIFLSHLYERDDILPERKIDKSNCILLKRQFCVISVQSQYF